MIYYILKVKGLAKIPDYLQVRDERYTLIFYGRPDRPEKRPNSLMAKCAK